ncbi:MAG: C4-dicarboxylate ABC transporter permease [Thermoanaerobaculia bacterium]
MKLHVPHTWVLLFSLILLAALATWFIPAGEYRYVDAGGRSLVDPTSFHSVPPQPAGVIDALLAFPRGLTETAAIVFYIFIIGGAFGVIDESGAISGGIDAVVKGSGGRGEYVLPLLMVLFAIAGGTIGMAEETLPFLPGLVILSRRLGYDRITGGAIALVGAGAGFAGAFLNPFTVGVAQGIAGLPLFSGISYRLLAWVSMTTIGIAYVSHYARRIRVTPSEAAEEGPGRDSGGLTSRHVLVLAVVIMALGAVVVGAMRWSWGIPELSALFLAVAIAAGLAGGLGADGTAQAFVNGAAAIAGGALVVGLARGVLVVFEHAHVIDTILNRLSMAVAGLPGWASAAGVYGVQVLLNFLVPSGSGQAALSIPILAPLGDLMGVTRQTSVLAFQLGDGITNVFTPTQGYFMAGLAVIGVSWVDWARFIWRLILLWLAAGLVLVLIAHAMRLGPF